MKKKKQMRIVHKGQSLVEVIIALAFAMVIIVALVTVTVQSMRNSTFAKNNAQATKLAQEGLEWIRSQRDQMAWDDFNDNLSSNLCLNNLTTNLEDIDITNTCSSCGSTLNNIYKRCADFSVGIGNCGSNKGVIVSVTWTDSAGNHSSVQTSCFSNWQNK